MKKFLFLAVLTTFVLTALPALATSDLSDPDNLGLGYGTYTGLGTKDVREGVMTIVNVLLGFLGIIAILIILYGGFLWMTAAGNEEKVDQAKKIITAGIIGLIIIFVSFAIATFVIESLITATI